MTALGARPGPRSHAPAAARRRRQALLPSAHERRLRAPARPRAFPWGRLLAVLASALLAAFLLVALRSEIFRLRYALGAAQAEEQELLEQRRTLTAELRRMRDPKRLRSEAEKRGFALPARVIWLDASGEPAGGGR